MAVRNREPKHSDAPSPSEASSDRAEDEGSAAGGAPADAVDGAEAVEESGPVEGTIGPAPVTPTSTSDAHQERVLFENLINEGAAAFAAEAHAAFIDAALRGKVVQVFELDPEDAVTEDETVVDVTVSEAPDDKG